jgi:7,8-dihydropterin-6-yl-methyl-4-(beta-D-ribofuranosyl)aminobenzene 5'-phosphate synthase
MIISHEHWDHVGGLWELLKKRKGIKVYVCPGFSDKFKSKVKASGGMLVESQSVTDIDSKISLTGEIPSTYKGEPMPEQALMIKNEKGITLVTGCSHPGIISMIKIVKDIYPDLPMHMVLGGFHLMRSDEETIRSIAKEMMNLGVKNTAPTHCSGDEAKKIFHEIYGTDYYDIGAGSTVNI